MLKQSDQCLLGALRIAKDLMLIFMRPGINTDENACMV